MGDKWNLSRYVCFYVTYDVINLCLKSDLKWIRLQFKNTNNQHSFFNVKYALNNSCIEFKLNFLNSMSKSFYICGDRNHLSKCKVQQK